MEFRLLGLVEVWSGGRPAPVGQPRQRQVLAALVIDAGRPVTPEALMYRVWGDPVPDGARHALHEYLARIRRLLAQVDDGEGTVGLARRGGVYVLDVDPQRVDLHRFRRLVDRVRGSQLGDLECVAVLDEALALWRGQPLADLAGVWVDQVREVLGRQRVEAAVLWGQGLLRLGRPGEVVEPLRELAAEHPLSEPVVGVLMRALSATGRTVEALDCYTTIRKRLVEDLGTDPGPDLQAVHQLVLRGGDQVPVLAVHPSTRPAVVPAQLPAAVRGFAGRGAELARLDALLDETDGRVSTVVICAVSGTAGVGKTALAVHWAYRVRDRFPDGQLYVNLRGFGPGERMMEPAEAVRSFLDALGVPAGQVPVAVDAQVALYRSLLADKRMLVLLDNARDVEQVRPLLPGGAAALAVVTSRHQLAGLTALDGAQPMALDLLSGEEARDLLGRRLGAELVAAEPESVEQIIESCARLPLALAITAARVQQTGFPLAALAADLADARERLDALDAGDPASQVRAVLSWSYSALEPASARLFRLLGLHAGPDIAVAAAASLVGLPGPATRRLLAELTRANLLTEHLPGRYAFHDLLRAYAADLVEETDPAAERTAALTRLLDHYAHTVCAASQAIHPGRGQMDLPLNSAAEGVTLQRFADRAAGMAWFETEHAVLLAALRHAVATGFDRHCWHLAWGLDTYLDWRGHWTDMTEIWRMALLAGGRLTGPGQYAAQIAQARAHTSLGAAANMLDRPDDAREALEAALDLYTAASDQVGQAAAHRGLSVLWDRRNDAAKALAHDRRALQLCRAVGDIGGEAAALNAVGWHLIVLGDHAGAVASCEEALVLHEQLGDRHGQAAIWDSIAYAEHHLGHHARAIESYRRALELLIGLGDHYNHAGTLDRLGDTHLAAGDVPAAHVAWRQALDILTGLDHPEATAVRAKLQGV